MDVSDRLTCVEAIRIEAILQEAMEKFSLLYLLIPNAIKRREEMSQRAGDDISRMIQEQRELEERFETLIANRAALKGMSNKTKFRENMDEIKEVSRQLRQNTKSLVRSLKDNPNVVENMMKVQNECNFVQELLGRTITELREHLRFSSLPSVVQQEQEKQSMLQSQIDDEKDDCDRLKALQVELANERSEHEKEVEARNRIIAKLKEEVKLLRATTSVEIKYAQKEAKARSGTAQRMYSKVEVDLKEEQERLKNQLNNELQVNVENEEFLKRRYDILYKMREEWAAKYEKEVREKDQELNDLKTNRDHDLALLKDYMEKYQKDQEEADAAARAEREAAELAAKRAAELRAQNEAAAKIQAVCRTYLIRKEVKKSKSKKKGKKGKKKGKGKGKGKGKK